MLFCLLVSFRDHLPQLWIPVHYTSMRKSAALLMQFNFLKAFSVQTKALHEPWTHIHRGSCQAAAVCALSVCQYIYRKTLLNLKRNSSKRHHVLPKYSTLQTKVWEQLTHHLHHIPTTRLNDKAASKKAQNKRHYHFK